MNIIDIKQVGKYMIDKFIVSSGEAWIFSGHYQDQQVFIRVLFPGQYDIFKRIFSSHDHVSRCCGYETFTYNDQIYRAYITEH